MTDIEKQARHELDMEKVARATEAMYEERKSGLLVPKVHAQIISLEEHRRTGT